MLRLPWVESEGLRDGANGWVLELAVAHRATVRPSARQAQWRPQQASVLRPQRWLHLLWASEAKGRLSSVVWLLVPCLKALQAQTEFR